MRCSFFNISKVVSRFVFILTCGGIPLTDLLYASMKFQARWIYVFPLRGSTMFSERVRSVDFAPHLYFSRKGSLISLSPWGELMMLMFSEGLYFLMLEVGVLLYSSRWVLERHFIAWLYYLLSRCCSSRCVTFLEKCVVFLAKCVAFLWSVLSGSSSFCDLTP